MNRLRWFPAISAVFVTCLVVSNIIAVKIASVGPLFLPAAVIIFPIAYIFGDILTEVYGFARARQVIWLGFACNLLAVAAIWIAIQLSPAPFWTTGAYDSAADAQRAFEAILGFAPRLLVASFAAYLAGEFLNSVVLARLKIATQGKYLWTRTIGSTIVGQFADSAIFLTIAFAGTAAAGDLARLIVTQWLVKTAYEAIATPLTYLVVNALKRSEQIDVYDRDTDFNPFRLNA